MENKSDLKYYRVYKKAIGEDRIWASNNRDKIIKIYQCGALLLNNKVGKTDSDKNAAHVIQRKTLSI